jgi:ribonucleoside-diphosphate reductase subunit M1
MISININRINDLIQPEEIKYLDINLIIEKAKSNSYPEISEDEIDTLLAEICINLSTTHPLYSNLGGRILVKNLHKKTLNNFSDKLKLLHINSDFIKFVLDNKDELNNIINYDRDYIYDYFGFKTLEKSYLLKSDNKIIERPQDMIMRTTIIVCNYDLKLIKETYEKLSLGYYTHASPTLFNAGTNKMQLSSCFLLGTNDDLNDIGDTWNTCAQISKYSGGIGLHITNIRGKNSAIKGTGGYSNGVVPFLKVFNEISRWIDQGGKRPGSIAIYLEPHHPDILEFLDLKKNFGSETDRARDLFYALWISDLFMKSVENDQDWYLLSSDECPNLNETFGNEYEELYWKYVNEGKYRKKINARKLWIHIIESQIETGMPYILYKDTINNNNNQKNLGTIKSSNLCAEIVQYSDHNEVAVCNLASIAINKCINKFDYSSLNNIVIYTKYNCIYCNYAKKYLTENNILFREIEYSLESVSYLKKLLNIDKLTFPKIFNNNILIGGWDDLFNLTKYTYNYGDLYKTAYLATINLNNVIDINYYPVEKAKISNLKHRPIGLGIQGLADTLVLLKISYDSDEAVEFNKIMMETIYLASLTASNDMAIERYNKIFEYYDEIKVIELPIYYDKNFIIKDNFELNNLYHDLKLHNFELKTNFLGAYSTFEGSLFSEGKFQFDMYPNKINLYYSKSWELLRHKIKQFGTRNSLLTSLMPTASTSQILGNNECFEFFTNNIYTRKTQAGDFMLVNKYLINDLIKIGLWTPELKDQIIANNGSIQLINEIPNNIKKLYKTIWEIPQIWTLKNAIARSYFIDQSQSMNIFMDVPNYQRLTSCHFYSWKNKLKTGMYYLRSKPSTEATKFTIDPKLINTINSCESCSG